MNQISELKNFLIAELKNYKLGDYSTTFSDITSLVGLLIDFINYDVHEEVLSSLKNKFYSSLYEFSKKPSVDVDELPKALEQLATGFESFLKKIAVIKFKGVDDRRLYGDGVHIKGLLNTTLGNLMMGKVDKVNNNSQTPTVVPIISFSFKPQNISELTYLSVRNLRNDVHLSIQRSLVDTLILFKQVIAAC